MGQRERPGAIEKVDDHTVRLNFTKPILSVPENLYNYPTAILHRDFEKNGKRSVEEPDRHRALHARRVRGRPEMHPASGPDMPYWGEEIDDPFMFGPIYLDEIHYYDHGAASAAQLAAFASGQVDAIYEFDIASLAMASSIPNATIYEAQTAQTGEPADAGRRRSRSPTSACGGRSSSAATPRPTPSSSTRAEVHGRRAPPRLARSIPNTSSCRRCSATSSRRRSCWPRPATPTASSSRIDCGNTNGPWQQQVCEILKGQLAAAGINLNINLMPADAVLGDLDRRPRSA